MPGCIWKRVYLGQRPAALVAGQQIQADSILYLHYHETTNLFHIDNIIGHTGQCPGQMEYFA